MRNSHLVLRKIVVGVGLICGVLSTVHAKQPLNPEGSSQRTEQVAVRSQEMMAVTANPLATDAAMTILNQGGSAADAAIAAQLVLNLVEPQSSGIGGGGFILAFHPKSGLITYDAREVAPLDSPVVYFGQPGHELSFKTVMNSGLSVGVPGLLLGLEQLHTEYGHLPWATLFAPAITLAEQGFLVSPRLHTLIQQSRADLARQPETAAYFLDAEQQAWPVGHRLRNPQFAAVLRLLAQQGSSSFYQGALARDMIAAVRNQPISGYLTEQDLRAYSVVKRPALCMTLKQWEICGMPPPSSGSLAVMQILGILQHTPIAQYAPDSWQAVHYFSEASRLAFADRDTWVADPDFVAVPVAELLSAEYLAQRAQGIQADQAMGVALPGELTQLTPPALAPALEQAATTHLVVADARGQLISMTSSIEAAFGSKIWVQGFLLNNQLTDFSFGNQQTDGRIVVNRLEPQKRPRSSMAPMMVFEAGMPVLALGSPGGSAIVLYVAQALSAMFYWNLEPQQAVNLDHYGSRNGPTELEADRPISRHQDTLKALGHEVRLQSFPSGTHIIAKDKQGVLSSGVDPRREGSAAGR
ncbi:gamma-glutamyltransferase [Alcaligenes endophyticus]|uniref:Glutathione hydrolase proenzyme n=1 Tax=Alcaligenes endophyticus TaxID=1929088 RepID=A0ABT8EH19_9BURK|nr:gamma-glutamyltransferase [Alcaligenes endophyticus]MCX5589766.1 gamma-glutamyltransferase [Alcaligenes endophyticus]MDN4120571.1 gamma-glutamyltransferase [Alcaligenes endophyticus]